MDLVGRTRQDSLSERGANAMNTEQRCGTCRYYEPKRNTAKTGYCIWAGTHSAPTHIIGKRFSVWQSEGRNCRCWLAKETQDAAFDAQAGARATALHSPARALRRHAAVGMNTTMIDLAPPFDCLEGKR